MALLEDVKYAYKVEWNDSISGVIWVYQLNFYPETGEIEMVRPAACSYCGIYCGLSIKLVAPQVVAFQA